MEAALKLGKTPTEWLQVDARDRVIILTHLANEADRCPLCGNYLSGGGHGSMVDSVICDPCAALDAHNEGNQKAPGEIRFAYHAPPPPELDPDS